VSNDEEIIKQLLTQIMSKWPNRNKEISIGKTANDLRDYLTKDFDLSNFSNRPFGTFSIFSKVLIIGDVAKVVVFDSAERQGVPNLAVFKREEDGLWRLDKFLFQCVSCFGTGILFDDNPCDTCGATGWGLVDWVKQKTDI